MSKRNNKTQDFSQWLEDMTFNFEHDFLGTKKDIINKELTANGVEPIK